MDAIYGLFHSAYDQDAKVICTHCMSLRHTNLQKKIIRRNFDKMISCFAKVNITCS